mmetsp:Transcript_43569/g.57697  ORF Transcript_43569/g.57697 Transcript_43569/m.57697 type:complete len:102 (-) Transcript_43569:387-692(-)|eukprot:CAMPEP_0185594026 /NCGR_PEP_ID=MMETSP0434-20130131/73458_1 /TAXON_ID=626734 ORGANISM="Favella taraikaensis, Strain Fe Narragansett Bay" /NCGR_SAMPLE_ID=MMETSP0434 /ASSEMBLY_ACC=CAM_ASM_000379 /LENGTH=101 /DNA_ID=CAMNT_0028221051 /DNA_START=1228 /DNA_END=1533 /DNA_ORIENTATION=-
MIGSPSAEDISFVTDDKAVKYLQRFKQKAPCNLRERYPEGSDQLLNLLARMLQFNPFYRPSVDSLIEDPYFDEVRMFSKSYDAPEVISLDFEMQQEYLGFP